MTVTKQGDRLIIRFPYHPTTKQLVKSLDGRVWVPSQQAWSIPLAGCGESITKLSHAGFKISDELIVEIQKDIKKSRKLVSLSEQKYTKLESSIPLYGYQKVGVKILQEIGSGLLGDSVGLGKTIMALALTEHADKTLIICPAALKYQWQSEIHKFREEEAQVIDGNKAQRVEQWKKIILGEIVNDTYIPTVSKKGFKCRDEKTIVIMNYEQLLCDDFGYVNIFDWDYIIADECTRISNHRAKVSKAIKKLKAKHRIAMTGTPVSNRANELWSIIDFISPGAFGNYWAFQSRYCITNHWGAVESYQNLDELAEKLKRYMIRRTKEEVLPELPAKTSVDVPFKLSKEEKTLYDKIKKEILFDIKKSDIDKIENPVSIQNTLVKMVRLRQLTDSMELLGSNKKSTKLEVLKELLEGCIDSGHKCLVFTQFSTMADILERELSIYNPLAITGKVRGRYTDIVNKFNNNDSNKVLILTSAGQYGLNIQAASVVFHYDMEWSLAKMTQRTGRAHRIGQKKNVLEYSLLAKGSIDMYIRKMLHKKAELSDKLLGDVPVTMNDIKEMLDYE